MLTITLEWDDEATGKRWRNQGRLSTAQLVGCTMADADEVARCVFDTTWRELVRVRDMDRVQPTRARVFPVRMDSGMRGVDFIPWDLAMMHEGRMMRSYGLSVPELALRGGLSYVELCEVLQDWPPGCLAAAEPEAREYVREAVCRFRESHGPGSHLSVVS